MSEMSYAKLQRAIWGVILSVLLVACSSLDTSAPEIRLSVDQTTLAEGGNVTLTAEVIGGVVTSVTFKGSNSVPIPPVTIPNEAGNFVANVLVNETTTFTAEAASPDGLVTTPPTESVTVAVEVPNPEAPDPEAPDSEAPSPGEPLVTYRNVTFVSGVEPDGFSAQSDWKVEGILGNIQEATVTTAQGGTVTIAAAQNALNFSYKPKENYVGADFFDYTVDVDGEQQTGTIKIRVEYLPDTIYPLSTLVNLKNTVVNQTVLVVKPLYCNSDSCAQLKEGQTLTGETITEDGVTLRNPEAKIIADIPGTRQAGTASGSGLESRVLELSDDTAVSHVEIVGSGEGYFTAIFAPTYDRKGGVLEGTIALEHIRIAGGSGKPLYFACKDYPCNPDIAYGGYQLLIDDLTVESAFDTLVIGVPGKLEFKNSSIELKQPHINSKAFGDNVGIDIVDLLGASLTLEGLKVYMESPRKQLDNGPLDYSAATFVIASDGVGKTTKLTVKNCDLSFGEPDANWSLDTVKTFKLHTILGSGLESVDSLGNTSEATGAQIERVGEGSFMGTLGGLE
ncbi:MAG: Ig-like domain-containing protein [Trueperaceae bacterium]